MESGILGGTLAFVLAAVMTWLGAFMLHETGVAVNIYDYSELSKHVFGNYGIAAFDWSIIIGGFGSQLAYVIVVGQTLSVIPFL